MATTIGRRRLLRKIICSQRLNRSRLHRLGAECGHALGSSRRPRRWSRQGARSFGSIASVWRPERSFSMIISEAVGLDDAQHAPDDVDDRNVRRCVSVREAATLEIRHAAFGEALPELVQQTRLADTRLAHDSDDLPTSSLRSRRGGSAADSDLAPVPRTG